MKTIALVAMAAGWMELSSIAFAQNAPPSDARIKQSLESQGYTNVQIGEHDEGHIDVRATKNGAVQKLAVNPKTGQISADTDKDEH